jgi:hypothetical protein
MLEQFVAEFNRLRKLNAQLSGSKAKPAGSAKRGKKE